MTDHTRYRSKSRPRLPPEPKDVRDKAQWGARARVLAKQEVELTREHEDLLERLASVYCARERIRVKLVRARGWLL